MPDGNKIVFRILAFAFALFLVSEKGTSQSFLNGGFETNTAGFDQINMTNAAFNAAMSNTFAFGSYGDMDIITSSTWGPPQSGSWYVALTGSGTDIITMKLSAPLVTGNSYTISFYDRGNSTFPTYPVQIGLSTVNSAIGTVIYTGPTPTYGTWSLRSFSFIAPNSGQYISVLMAGGGLSDWVNVDNFRFISTLPVELLSFKGENKSNRNFLSWSTASEINNDYFEIEKSGDGREFNRIGSVKGVGNSTVMTDYSFIDDNSFNSICYYRLRQVDYDGKYVYSQIIAIKSANEPLHWSFYEDENNITFSLLIPDDGVITITDINGRIILDRQFANCSIIMLNRSDYSAGIYLVRLGSLAANDTFKFVRY